ncbi:hypothetical protein J437_LFUL018670, partial [Ladona fulva]
MKIEEIDVKEEECGSERECVRCYHCGEERLSKEELREHIYSHHSSLFLGGKNGRDVGANNVEKPLNCHVCNYRTSRSYSLKEHVRIHTGEKPYKCDVTAQLSNMKRHSRKHTGEKPFKCDVCEYSSTNRKSLKIHIGKHTGVLPYKCDVCGYGTTCLSDMKVHSFKHTGEKPFKCKVCNYRTSSISYLKDHIRKHTGEKPFKCDVCEYSTAHRKCLKIHTIKHTGEFTYKCDICEYRTAQLSNRKRHSLKHTGENIEVLLGDIFRSMHLRKYWNVINVNSTLSRGLSESYLRHSGEKIDRFNKCGFYTASRVFSDSFDKPSGRNLNLN